MAKEEDMTFVNKSGKILNQVQVFSASALTDEHGLWSQGNHKQFYKRQLNECMEIVDELLPKDKQYTETWHFLVGVLFLRNSLPLSRIGASKKKPLDSSNAKEEKKDLLSRIGKKK